MQCFVNFVHFDLMDLMFLVDPGPPQWLVMFMFHHSTGHGYMYESVTLAGFTDPCLSRPGCVLYGRTVEMDRVCAGTIGLAPLRKLTISRNLFAGSCEQTCCSVRNS